MKYDELIESISTIVNDDRIIKKGLTLTYVLDDKAHRQLDEELFIKFHGDLRGFEHQEVIEIELGGLLIKFVQEEKDLGDKK